MGKSSHRTPRIVYIGAGNVATHLAPALDRHFDVVQVYSPTPSHAEALARKLRNADAVKHLEQVARDADIYLFSVKDDVLKEVIDKMPPCRKQSLWLHTSGSCGLEVFASREERKGVLYPLQTFSKTADVEISEIPFFIEADNNAYSDKIEEIAMALSKRVYHADSEHRRMLHLAAVFACNFSNHLYTLSRDILADAKLPFDVMLPLVRATVEKISEMPPEQAQTGPAARGDRHIIGTHLDMLTGDKKEIYRLMSESIINYKKNNEQNKLRLDKNTCDCI